MSTSVATRFSSPFLDDKGAGRCGDACRPRHGGRLQLEEGQRLVDPDARQSTLHWKTTHVAL